VPQNEVTISQEVKEERRAGEREENSRKWQRKCRQDSLSTITEEGEKR
jgi:hypothetical protein